MNVLPLHPQSTWMPLAVGLRGYEPPAGWPITPWRVGEDIYVPPSKDREGNIVPGNLVHAVNPLFGVMLNGPATVPFNAEELRKSRNVRDARLDRNTVKEKLRLVDRLLATQHARKGDRRTKRSPPTSWKHQDEKIRHRSSSSEVRPHHPSKGPQSSSSESTGSDDWTTSASSDTPSGSTRRSRRRVPRRRALNKRARSPASTGTANSLSKDAWYPTDKDLHVSTAMSGGAGPLGTRWSLLPIDEMRRLSIGSSDGKTPSQEQVLGTQRSRYPAPRPSQALHKAAAGTRYGVLSTPSTSILGLTPVEGFTSANGRQEMFPKAASDTPDSSAAPLEGLRGRPVGNFLATPNTASMLAGRSDAPSEVSYRHAGPGRVSHPSTKGPARLGSLSSSSSNASRALVPDLDGYIGRDPSLDYKERLRPTAPIQYRFHRLNRDDEDKKRPTADEEEEEEISSDVWIVEPVVRLVFRDTSFELAEEDNYLDAPNAITAAYEAGKHRLKPGHILRIPVYERRSSVFEVIQSYLIGNNIIPLGVPEIPHVLRGYPAKQSVDPHQVLLDEAQFYGLKRLEDMLRETIEEERCKAERIARTSTSSSQYSVPRGVGTSPLPSPRLADPDAPFHLPPRTSTRREPQRPSPQIPTTPSVSGSEIYIAQQMPASRRTVAGWIEKQKDDDLFSVRKQTPLMMATGEPLLKDGGRAGSIAWKGKTCKSHSRRMRSLPTRRPAECQFCSKMQARRQRCSETMLSWLISTR